MTEEQSFPSDMHIQNFLEFMREERALNTVKAYRADLCQFHGWLQDRGISDWTAVTGELLKSFRRWMRDEKGYADATVARKLVVLRGFFEYLTAERVIRTNHEEDLPKIVVKRQVRRVLTPEEMKGILEQSGKRPTPEAKRDKAMLALLCATCMRVSELVGLNLDSIEIDNRHITVCCKSSGGRMRSISIAEQTVNALCVYLKEARPELNALRPDERALFLGPRGRITRQGFWGNLRRYAKEAGLDGVNFEVLRRSSAVNMFNNGVPLKVVQRRLGHSYVYTTRAYTRKDGYATVPS